MLLRILFIIRKNRHHFAFILSVIFSFILIYNSTSSNSNYFRETVNIVAEFIKSPFTRLTDLSKTKIENELLREQLLLLSLEKESFLAQGIENDQLRNMLNMQQETNINLLPAKVTNMGITANLTSITINVGADKGVNRNDPVITPSGVIGKIYSVTKKSSIIQLISDSEFRIGIRFIPSGETGILRWKNNNICEVREVYKNANINVGDRVITSGLSDIFPDNLPVGMVASVANDRTQFQKIVSVKIDDNLNALRYVFVIVDGISK